MPTPLPYPKPIQETEPEVFIIESLTVENEIRDRYEGKALRDSLRISGQKPAYYYVRDYNQLLQAIELFRHSGYRFLHISAHGSVDRVNTTLESITNQEFASALNGKLKNRRLFFSACEIGSGGLPQLIQAANNNGMYSITAPLDTIQFCIACAFWTAFYARVLNENPLGMEVDVLKPTLTELCNFFSVRINWSYHLAHNNTWDSCQIG